ncbi:hypothetical protein QLH51_19725, partial [Sphingomonas sp. 2R-10]|nr:hypothetical protein [Sphingomonas sp. 2R-10]
MPDDRDLGRQLPDAPPPRPDRRETAIDAAVARFRGEAAPARRPPPRRRWTRLQPQIGVVAATALVVVIGLPVWRSGKVETPLTRQAPPIATDRAGVTPPPRAERARPVPAPSASEPEAAAPAPTARPDAAMEAPEAPEVPATPPPAA